MAATGIPSDLILRSKFQVNIVERGVGQSRRIEYLKTHKVTAITAAEGWDGMAIALKHFGVSAVLGMNHLSVIS